MSFHVFFRAGSHVLLFNVFISPWCLLDDLPNDITVPTPYDDLVPQTPESFWLMGELSAVAHLSSVPSRFQDECPLQEDALHPSSLPGLPEYHYLHYNYPRSGFGLGLGSGDRSRRRLERVYRHGRGSWCLGGNNYSYDGFFVGRCQDGCVSFSAGDESGTELWTFGFVSPSLDELDAGS